MDNSLILTQLIKLLDKKRVLIEEGSKQHYGTDLSQQGTPTPLAIAFPKTEEEIIEIVKLAHETRVGLVPSGGRTGYSGGALAQHQELVVSFEKMNRILDFNAADRQITCEPGVTTATIQNFALNKGLFYPVQFASSGSSQIGGNIATNAGGIHVVRYGLTRQWVAGLHVVTGNGERLRLNQGLIKNAAGYDLRHLFIGSEGTLGFITQATLQLTTPPTETRVMLCALPNPSYFINLLNIFREALTITAFEFFSEIAIRHVIHETKLKHPFGTPTPFYALLEYESPYDISEKAISIAQKCLNQQWITDAMLSNSLQQASTFWRFREDISMSLLKHSPYKYDIAVRPSQIASFIQNANQLLNELYPNYEIVWFGHVGDGNLHLNILKPNNITPETFFANCVKLSENLYKLIQDYCGSVSAEHGVGLLKKDFLHYGKSASEIQLMNKIKTVFDRKNIMNPGKMI